MVRLLTDEGLLMRVKVRGRLGLGWSKVFVNPLSDIIRRNH